MVSLGVRLPDEAYGYTIDECLKTAELAESLGCESLWAAEGWGRDALMTLGQVATVTESAALGTGIVNVYSRSPMQLAMSVATLEEISDGRSILGLSPGVEFIVENLHDLSFDRPLEHLQETAEIIDVAMKQEQVTYDGEVFQTDHPRRFDPIRDHVPVYNAALAKRNRRLTGAFADGWLPSFVPLERYPDCIEDVREGAREAGRDPDGIDVVPYICTCVASDRDVARRRLKRTLAFYIGATDYYAGVFSGFGFLDAVSHVQAAWDRDGKEAAARAVPDRLLESVAIAGNPEECRSRVQKYFDLGVDTVVLYVPEAASDEIVEETIREMGRAAD